MFLDTTIIIEILKGGSESQPIEKIIENIKNEPLFISKAQIAELSDWCINNDTEPLKRITQIKEIMHVIPLSEKICLNAADIKHEMRNNGIKKFSLMDGIILASARSINQKLLTADTDFRKAEDVIILK